MGRTYYYSVYHWTGGPPDTADRVRALRAAGIDGLEFGSRPEYEPGLEELLAHLGGSVILHNYFPPPEGSFVFNLASADKAIRARSLALARRALSLSAEIAAPCYAVHAGFVVDPIAFDGTSFVFPPAGPDAVEGAHGRFLDSVRDLSAHAHHVGVRLLIENNVCPVRLRGKLLLQTSEEFTRLFADLGADADPIGILLDTGHLAVSAATLRQDAELFVDHHCQRIVALHLHENDLIEDRHWMVTENGQAVGLARDCRYAEWVTIEAKCQTVREVASQLSLVRAALGDGGR